MDKINTELLISLVEERPVIWDKTLDLYKDKNLKESAWREICIILNEGFEELEQKKRQDFGKHVVKKWTQIRDSWMKCIKKHNDQKKSGSSAKPSRLYLYHDQMCFLKKITDTTITHESTDENKNEESTDDNKTDQNEESREIIVQSASKPTNSSGIQRKRKQEINNELDSKMIKFIDHQITSSKNHDHDNRHLSFFKGLLPSLSSFNDDQTLEFQAGIINLLQKIKRNTQAQFNNFPNSQPARQMNYHYEYQNSGYFTQPPSTNMTVPPPIMSPATESSKSPSAQSTISISSHDSDYSIADVDFSSF